MTQATIGIAHHPSEDLLTAHATGALSGAYRAAVATHLWACAQCRRQVAELEHAGGEALAEVPPTNLGNDALNQVLERLPRAGTLITTDEAPSSDMPPLLPPMLRRKTSCCSPRCAG